MMGPRAGPSCGESPTQEKPMKMTRRRFVQAASAAALLPVPAAPVVAGMPLRVEDASTAAPGAGPPRARNRIGVSTYSFWHFRGPPADVGDCIDRAAAMGFDGVEILHRQMKEESNAHLQSLKRRAF